MEQTTPTNVTFSVTDETRNAIHAVIANKPFNAVFGITQIIAKDELTEQEANAVINALGQFPYAEVADFFANIGSYFVQNEETKEETNKTNETKETIEAVK